MSTKYMHFRKRNGDNYDARGGMTVAYTETGGGIITYAKAQCHEGDNYSKAAGRDRARGRLGSALSNVFHGTESEFQDAIVAEANRFGFERRFGKTRKPRPLTV